MRWAKSRDLGEAYEHSKSLYEAVKSLPESPERSELALEACTELLHLGWRRGLDADEAGALFEEGRRIAVETENHEAQAVLMDRFASVNGLAGDLRQFLEVSQEAWELAAQACTADVQVACLANYVHALYLRGKLAEALKFNDIALSLSEERVEQRSNVAGFSLYPAYMYNKGILLAHMGKLREARKCFGTAFKLVADSEDLEVRGWAHGAAVLLAWLSGEPGDALKHGLLTVQYAERSGSTYSLVHAHYWLARAHLICGEIGQAIAGFRKAIDTAIENRTGREREPEFLAWLADAQARAGNVALARQLIDESREKVQVLGAPLQECQSLLVEARVLRVDSDRNTRDQAADCLARALNLIEATGAIAWEPYIRVELAELAKLSGDMEMSNAEFGKADQLFTVMRS